MHLRVCCANESCRVQFPISASPPAGALTCPRCGHAHAWAPGAVEEDPIRACPVCGGEELYLRKDFPQRLGVALVVIVAVLSFWLFARGDLLWALGVLLGLALLDLVVYAIVPRITVCYRCRTEFCGTQINPEHAGFDLATAEKYR